MLEIAEGAGDCWLRWSVIDIRLHNTYAEDCWLCGAECKDYCLVFAAAVTELTIDITNCMKTAEDCVLC